MILKVFFKKINKKNIILIYFQIKFILKKQPITSKHTPYNTTRNAQRTCHGATGFHFYAIIPLNDLKF